MVSEPRIRVVTNPPHHSPQRVGPDQTPGDGQLEVQWRPMRMGNDHDLERILDLPKAQYTDVTLKTVVYSVTESKRWGKG